MSTNPSWISKLVSLVRPYAGTIIFAFSILSASVTYVLVQGSTARSIDYHERRLGEIETKVDKITSIDGGIATLLERTENMAATLAAVQGAQMDDGKRLLAVETRLEAQHKNVDRFWAITWPEMARRIERLETLTITPKNGGNATHEPR